MSKRVWDWEAEYRLEAPAIAKCSLSRLRPERDDLDEEMNHYPTRGELVLMHFAWINAEIARKCQSGSRS